MISFKCKTTDIQLSFKNLRPALPTSKNQLVKLICEFEFQINNLNIAIPGANVTCNIESFNVAKAFIPYLIVKGILADWEKEMFAVTIENGKIFGGTINVESPMIKIVHPENQRKIDLPINYRAIDILKMREAYSVDELERRNMLELLEKYEEELSNDIREISDITEKYNLKYEEVKNLINQKIKNHKL